MEAIQVTEDAFTGYNRISMARDLLPICKHSIKL